MKNKILLGLLAAFVIIQFFRPEKNQSNDETNSITTKYQVPENVTSILKVACYDCHSNNTRYPWYANVQPTAWLLAHDVEDGKRELNFSNFTSRPVAVQNKKFNEIAEQVEKHDMPIEIYTLFGLHSDAKLTEEQRKTIINWATSQMDFLKTHYPADSLVLKRKGPPSH